MLLEAHLSGSETPPNPWETSSSSWDSHPPQLPAAGRAQLKLFLPPGSFVSAVIRTYFLSWRITRGCNEDVCVCTLSLKLSFLSLVPPKVLKSTDRHLGLPWENTTSPEACGCLPPSWLHEQSFRCLFLGLVQIRLCFELGNKTCHFYRFCSCPVINHQAVPRCYWSLPVSCLSSLG